MAKRGYKFYEVEAHASNVKCIKIGKKSCGLFVTGGEDHRVNLWAIGKSNSLLSLFGHTCPVESVTFDSEEVLVVSGASGGAIKLWDLEEAKIVRTIAGHRTNCTSVEFHPFGEFFASGSLDANLKIWDIRRKGCIHTYRGHTQGINTIRFTPDGRWVVTGGEDNVVKLWDLTAGKLLHDFKFHEGQIRCIDFHPHEFLLATGSADGTVKFWDLETFELIGSAGPEATGVRSMIFHPDGRTLFCGFDESLKVFSWEPIICHDALDMGWSTLCDLSIYEGKLFGCSYHQSTVGVWVAHTSLIGPYAAGILPKSSEPIELKYIVGQNQSAQQIQSNIKSSEKLLTTEQECGAKDLMRSLSVKSTESSHSAPRIIFEVPLPSTISKSRGSKSSTPKKSSMIEEQTRNSGQLISRQVTVPGIVPRNSSDMEQAAESRKEIAANESIPPVEVFSKPSCERKLPSVNRDIARQCNAQESGPLSGKTNDLVSAVDQNFCSRFIAEDNDRESSVNIRVVAEKFEKILSPDTLLSNRLENVKPGRTRSLVERWEQRERCINNESPTTKSSSLMPEADTLRPSEKGQKESSGNDLIAPANEDATENLMQNHDSFISVLQSRLTKLQDPRTGRQIGTGLRYTRLSGFHGVLSGFMVGAKQTTPDQEILALGSFNMRAEWLPSLLVFMSVIISFVTPEALSYLPFVIFGTYGGWLYLRYLLRNTETNLNGDPKDEFSFSTFFPGFIRPAVDFIASIFHKLLCGKRSIPWRVDGDHVSDSISMLGFDTTESSRRDIP